MQSLCRLVIIHVIQVHANQSRVTTKNKSVNRSAPLFVTPFWQRFYCRIGIADDSLFSVPLAALTSSGTSSSSTLDPRWRWLASFTGEPAICPLPDEVVGCKVGPPEMDARGPLSLVGVPADCCWERCGMFSGLHVRSVSVSPSCLMRTIPGALGLRKTHVGCSRPRPPPRLAPSLLPALLMA